MFSFFLRPRERAAAIACCVAVTFTACEPGTDPKPKVEFSASNSVASGDHFNCALNATGMAFCWGSNSAGQLGNGSTFSSGIPTPVSQGEIRFTQISATASNACAVTVDHDLYCWGANTYGQLGNGTTTPGLTPNAIPVRVSGELEFQLVATGNEFVCALTLAGQAHCWGRSQFGQGGYGNSAITQASVPGPVASQQKFTSISAGLWTACGVTEAGEGYCWGNNSFGSVGVGTTDNPIYAPTLLAGGHSWTEVSAGAGTTCGIASDGTYCWGSNFFGAVGDGTTSSMGSRSPVLVAGGIPLVRVRPGTGNNVFNPTCGLTATGAAYCWGANSVGQLGTNSTAETCTFNATFPLFGCSGVPLPVGGGLSFLTLRVGSEHVCGITAAKDFVCWGRNTDGQLGDGTFSNSTSPVVVSGGLKAP